MVIKTIRQSISLSSEQPVSAFPGGHGEASNSEVPFPEVLVQSGVGVAKVHL